MVCRFATTSTEASEYKLESASPTYEPAGHEHRKRECIQTASGWASTTGAGTAEGFRSVGEFIVIALQLAEMHVLTKKG